ncbi:MAG: hypothetical protein ABL996_06620 [Micropepsaceae bacterium]
MNRLAFIVSFLPLAVVAQAAPMEPTCETMTEMHRLVASDAFGVSTHLVQGNWVLDQPFAGAEFCIVQAKTEKNGRANVTCSWTTAGETAARAAFKDTLSTLLSCRPTQRQRQSPAAPAENADATAITMEDNGNEAWVVKAKAYAAKPGTWDLLVTAAVRDVTK